jgi:hypothetical protein
VRSRGGRPARSPVGPTAITRSALAVVGQPDLWPVAVRQASRLAAPGWWRRPPFLPVPDRDYLRFRLQTMYGDGVAQPEAGDLLTWLRWCRQFDRLTGSGPRS